MRQSEQFYWARGIGTFLTSYSPRERSNPLSTLLTTLGAGVVLGIMVALAAINH